VDDGPCELFTDWPLGRVCATRTIVSVDEGVEVSTIKPSRWLCEMKKTRAQLTNSS
jgi:hypothetical protein